MPSPELFVAFIVASIIMNVAPGPSSLYVLARSIAQGEKAGMVAALGLAVGAGIHVGAAVLGLSAIFLYSPTLYLLVKLVGAAYLIYLGVHYWRSAKVISTTKKLNIKPIKTIFRESVLVELTNPKTALFYMAVLPQFVSLENGNTQWQLLVLSVVSIVIALIYDGFIGKYAGRLSGWLQRNQTVQIIQNRISGTILVALGAFIAGGEVVK